MTHQIPYLRVFLSSPGDVTDERKIALDIIENLPYRPAFRDKVAFRVIAWDKAGAGTAMRASLTPQEAINKRLPLPSACDIVITLFWSRMGTPFVDTDGERYLSGTHWELLDALGSPQTITLIYQRTETPNIRLDDPKRSDKLAQYDTVTAFLKSELFYTPDGTIKRGINMYSTLDDFRSQFATHFEDCVWEILDALAATPRAMPADDEPPPSPNVMTLTPTPWVGSPFPGLRAFTPDDAPIFFGRGRETDELVQKVASTRVVAVVGASGSGKSSLVGAGLIPRLAAGALADETRSSQAWQVVSFTPGKGNVASPFEALFDGLIDAFPALKPNPLEARRMRLNFVQDMLEAPATIIDIAEAALADGPQWGEVLLFIDQFEELFTLAPADHLPAFVEMLAAVGGSQRVRAVLTMRSDFYHRCVDVPTLAGLLQAGSFPLAAPNSIALYEMITRPAEVAALSFEDGIPDQILADTGTAPGSLALLAYALDELYKLATARADQHLTFGDYAALGYVAEDGSKVVGVQGAIGKRAEQVFGALDPAMQDQLGRVFHRLVEVDERGTATRRRVEAALFADNPDAQHLIAALVDERLLVSHEGVLEVAHEALLRHWPRLAAWIETTQDDLRLLRQVRLAAEEWVRREKREAYCWPQERLTDVHHMVARLDLDLSRDFSDDEMAFLEGEHHRLLRELADINTTHQRRLAIGERLNALNDPRRGVGLTADGLPDIEWCQIGDGTPITVELKDGHGAFEVQTPFYMAKYPITMRQFWAFIMAPDGWKNLRWWEGLAADEEHKEAPDEQRFKFWNHPREMVSWYDALAFCRWLSWRSIHGTDGAGTPLMASVQVDWGNPLTWPVRLPTEMEWQAAATGGDPQRVYPWGPDWDGRCANTRECGLQRTTAVGMYPSGASPFGVLDMSGNVWEWCLGEYEKVRKEIDITNNSPRVARGGSWLLSLDLARAASRDNYYPNYRSLSWGFRVVVSAPIPSGALVSGG